MQDNFYGVFDPEEKVYTDTLDISQGRGFLLDLNLNQILTWLLGSVLLVILSVFLVIFLLNLFRRFWYQFKRLKDWKKMVILEISVPRETVEQAQKEKGNSNSGRGENNPELAPYEQLYVMLSEYSKPNWKTWLFGGENFSLEIVNIKQETRFWLACAKDIAPVIERQMVSIYPKAHIVRLKEVNFFKDKSQGYAQELTLANRFELPFKTYKLLDSDPLAALTSALSGLEADESACIQLIITPVDNKRWQKRSNLLALQIQQGQNPKEILNPDFNLFKELVKILKEIVKIFKPEKKEETPKEERDIDLTGKKHQINLTPQQQEIVKKLEEKASKPGFLFTLRVVGAAKDKKRAKQIVEHILPVFQIFAIQPSFNSFKKKDTSSDVALYNYLYRAPSFNQSKIINTEEINSLWHLPNYLVQTPNIKWLPARKPPIPLELPPKGKDTVYVGVAEARGVKKEVYLKMEDRFRHIYSLGGSGSGKTVTMNNIALQDIQMGNGICFVDPHGEGVDDLLRRMPEERIEDVIVFSPAITDRPLGLNMLETDPLKPQQKTLVIETLFQIWDKLYDLKKTGGPMFENYMKNAMRLVMSHPESGCTLMEIPKVLADEDFRSFKLAMCEEQEVVDFWEKEALKAGGEASLENMVPYITSKLAPFLQNDFIRPMIGQQKSVINFRQAMDNRKIILVSLSKGLIGEGSAYLIGMIIIGNLLMSGMGRSDGLKYNLDGTITPITPEERPPFFVYIDEMQNFLFDAIPKALEEIRKYKVGFYLAHQFIKQVIVDGSERIKDSIMANCATKFIFRCAADDAKYLESEFSPLSIEDIANPAARTFNAICLVDGQRTKPFNINAYYPDYFSILDKSRPELLQQAEEKRKRIIQMVKDKYGRDPEEIEKEIRNRAKLLF